jgi:hypothetical protein
MPFLSRDGRYFVLALSQNSVRLFEATEYAIRELDQEDIPSSLGDAVVYDQEQKNLQFHTGAPGRGVAAPRDAIYHGHGRGIDDTESDLDRFLSLVDAGIRKLLTDSDAPLVVASVDRLFAAFREMTRYPDIVDQNVSGNPDSYTFDELHQKSWALAAPYLRRDQDMALIRFREVERTPAAGDDLSTIVPAACNSRIDTLFVSLDEQVWGTYDRGSEHLRVHENLEQGGEDLLDLAAVECLLHGGAVYVLPRSEMPVPGPAAALFRYERKKTTETDAIA